MFRIGVVASLFWAVGTNLLEPRWYVVHGVSIGDVVFAVWLAAAMLSPSTREELRRT
jgi:hypothetical protein